MIHTSNRPPLFWIRLAHVLLVVQTCAAFTAISVANKHPRLHLPRSIHVSTDSAGVASPPSLVGRHQYKTVHKAQALDALQGTSQEQANALKAKILQESKGTSNGLEATPEQRENIAEAVNALVGLNPTTDITTSEIATGMWDLVYTTTSGSSGGKLGPFIGKVQQEVDIAEGLYVNYVRLGPLTGRLDATWEVINQKQWKVIFQTIAFLLWGTQVVKKELGQEGLWTLSYLDQDMRILTARSFEKKNGNLYILAKA